MKYTEYLHIQSQMERMHDFHPEFFDTLNDAERNALQKGFLYDTDDDTYPISIRRYFEENIAKNIDLQRQMFAAAQRIYTLSNSGDLTEDLKDIVSFSEE